MIIKILDSIVSKEADLSLIQLPVLLLLKDYLQLSPKSSAIFK